MDINIENLLDKVSDHVKTLASTETILGEEFTLGEFTCRPVIKVGTGFGSGAASGKDPKSNKGAGGGAGAGIGITPLGFLTTKGDEIYFIPSDKKSAFSTLIEQVPDLVEKVAEMKNKEDKNRGKDEFGGAKEEKKEEKASK
jgi:uncharacterized spore protein YtfJ